MKVSNVPGNKTKQFFPCVGRQKNITVFLQTWASVHLSPLLILKYNGSVFRKLNVVFTVAVCDLTGLLTASLFIFTLDSSVLIQGGTVGLFHQCDIGYISNQDIDTIVFEFCCQYFLLIMSKGNYWKTIAELIVHTCSIFIMCDSKHYVSSLLQLVCSANQHLIVPNAEDFFKKKLINLITAQEIKANYLNAVCLSIVY